MIFKCKNCGGNVVYSPEKEKMYCPYCDSEDSQEQQGEQGIQTCLNCGGELQVGDYTSASQCPYCNSYLIYDERVTGEYTPHLILPFKVTKEAVKKMLREKFKRSVFAPGDFFSDAKLDGMQGRYVPFWLYDYQAKGYYEGQGTKIRTWRSGDRQYTETSIYRIEREMDASFDKVPVDASESMPDSTMDLMEPYDYKALEDFQAKYMSGFYGERYNQDAEAMEQRAKGKSSQDAASMLHSSISGYATVRATRDGVELQRTEANFALFPVWVYTYKYKDQEYTFHVNGQTGKIVGKMPILPGKVLAYSATVFGLIFSCMLMLRFLIF